MFSKDGNPWSKSVQQIRKRNILNISAQDCLHLDVASRLRGSPNRLEESYLRSVEVAGRLEFTIPA